MRMMIAVATAACLIAACSPEAPTSGTTPGEPRASFTVETAGAQRETIMEGKRDSVIELAALPSSNGLIALGPIEGLTGEITIIDGKVSLARVAADGSLMASNERDVGAPFLVWADVRGEWTEIALPPNTQTLAALETFVGEQGQAAGLEGAFPFKVTGRPDRVSLHVLKADPAKPHPAGMDAHKDIQAHFEIVSMPVTLAGFYSRKHQGVFTHMGSNSHVHVVADSGDLSGHAQEVEFGTGAFTLFLPAP